MDIGGRTLDTMPRSRPPRNQPLCHSWALVWLGFGRGDGGRSSFVRGQPIRHKRVSRQGGKPFPFSVPTATLADSLLLETVWTAPGSPKQLSKIALN